MRRRVDVTWIDAALSLEKHPKTAIDQAFAVEGQRMGGRLHARIRDLLVRRLGEEAAGHGVPVLNGGEGQFNFPL